MTCDDGKMKGDAATIATGINDNDCDGMMLTVVLMIRTVAMDNEEILVREHARW